MLKGKCDCAPVMRPELRLTGDLDPPNPGYYCHVCKKKWHSIALSQEYIDKMTNMARTYKYSIKPTFVHKWISEDDFKRLLERLEIKKINKNPSGEYTCTF